ncbi:hypothetical protein Q7P37_001550 [Cladosporium fusiforme]
MTAKKFFLCGDATNTAVELDISADNTLEELHRSIAAHYGVVQPEGLAFQAGEAELTDFQQVLKGFHMWATTSRVIYPDHLGNNRRLFDKYGPIFKSTNMGKTVCQTNDPAIGQIVFTESDFFSKEVNDDHPLKPIKQDAAGVFLTDPTPFSDQHWKLVHKYLPPALGPKAVRHYAPKMNEECRVAFPVFDELSERNEAWNIYQYMLKLSSAAVEVLVINKKISTMGQWYSQLPFGDPKRLRDLQHEIASTIIKSMQEAKAAGTEDLPLQEAALKAADVIDYLNRAVDSNGERLPVENIVPALTVAAGAGFTTTSSLLSWLVYGLVAYDGMQARLLQELVDHDFTDDTAVTPELLEDLPMLDKFIREMQRRHNPSYQPGRTAQRDLILPGGYKVRKGTVIIVALHHIHMNPKVWDNPNLFDPDRWDTERVKNRSRTDSVPFAAGQRMCIGFNFTLQKIKIFMCLLVWRYKWLKEGEPEADYDPFFQLIRPINLYVRTKKREIWPSKSDSVKT